MDLRTGRVLPTFKKTIYQEMIDSIAANTSHYYAFAAVTDKTTDNVEIITDSDYINQFTTQWKTLFGKRLNSNNITAVIKKNTWAPNTVYSKYDNTEANLHFEANFYVYSPPAITGGAYHVYKCIDNANNSPSTVKPIIVQPTTFQTPDGYKWRYLTSVSYKDFQNYSSVNYSPIYSNSSIAAGAANNSGVEVVMVTNNGTGYSTWHNGTIKAKPTTKLVQISDDAYNSNNFYNRSAIYLYNEGQATSQLLVVKRYEANTTGKWIEFETDANAENIAAGSTQYKIAPRVVFDTDGDENPIAYATVNAVGNGIYSVTILDQGKNISWANVSLQCNVIYGTGARMYAIVPPPGGHGSDPESELDIKGMSIHFEFSNNEISTIPTNDIVYDTVGLIKNPYFANNSNTLRTKTQNRFWGNTFNQLTTGNVSITFSIGEKVQGNTSGAIGEVVFSNSSQVYLVGDKYFQDDEYIIASNGVSTQFFINTQPQVYSKDMVPLYVQYINTIDRPITNSQTESFNLLLQF